MKRLGYLLFAVLAITLMLGGNAVAAVGRKATIAPISSPTTPMRIPRVFRMQPCVSSTTVTHFAPARLPPRVM